MRKLGAAAGLLLGGWMFVVLTGVAGGTQPGISVLRIGVVASLMGGEGAKALGVAKPLGDMLGGGAGVRVDFSIVPDANEMAKLLREGQLHLGVMQGIEYAWSRESAPELEPLVLAFNQAIRLKSQILVRADSPIKTFGDLKGQKLTLPRKSPNHCALFLQKNLLTCGCESGFCQFEEARNTDESLDLVVDGHAAAVVIDGAAFEGFRERKPGRAKRLRVLDDSPSFPTAAIVHKPGVLQPGETQRLRENLLTVHERPLGKQLLMFWKLSQFVNASPEYHLVVKDILKDFPKPLPTFVMPPLGSN